jgi:arsenate reductase
VLGIGCTNCKELLQDVETGVQELGKSVERRNMSKMRVLFICTYNAARSQMAEGYLRTRYGDRYEVYSAGTEPSRVSQYAIKAMAEIGVDISGQESKSLSDFIGKEMDVVVTVCDGAKKSCPVFPWAKKVIHQSFPDPGLLQGSDEAILAGFRMIRDDLVKWIDQEFRN